MHRKFAKLYRMIHILRINCEHFDLNRVPEVITPGVNELCGRLAHPKQPFTKAINTQARSKTPKGIHLATTSF